jgi:hypothetical protein
MQRKFFYGGQLAAAESAAGIRGVLLRSSHNTFVFRVYQTNGQFTDYDIRHGELSVTIDADELAAFYTLAEREVLDHAPEVLGLKEMFGLKKA